MALVKWETPFTSPASQRKRSVSSTLHHPWRNNTCYPPEVQNTFHLFHIYRPSSICWFGLADVKRITNPQHSQLPPWWARRRGRREEGRDKREKEKRKRRRKGGSRGEEKVRKWEWGQGPVSLQTMGGLHHISGPPQCPSGPRLQAGQRAL